MIMAILMTINQSNIRIKIPYFVYEFGRVKIIIFFRVRIFTSENMVCPKTYVILKSRKKQNYSDSITISYCLLIFTFHQTIQGSRQVRFGRQSHRSRSYFALMILVKRHWHRLENIKYTIHMSRNYPKPVSHFDWHPIA